MPTRRWRLLAAVLASCLVLPACARDAADTEAFADVIRATALRARAGHPDRTVRVLDRAPGSQDAPLTFDAGQALITAGFELAETMARTDTGGATLRFRSVEQADSVWEVRTELSRTPPGGAPAAVFEETTWRVRCGETCAVVDSAATGHQDGVMAAPLGAEPADWLVTPERMGTIRFGMGLSDLRAHVGVPLDFDRPGDDDACAYVTPALLPAGASLMIVDMRYVARADVRTAGVATAEGIRVGNTEEDVRTAYGERVRSMPHKYDTGGRYLVVDAAADTTRALVFEVDSAGTIQRYRAGLRPAVLWVEGCL
jgi:hypothetical protein